MIYLDNAATSWPKPPEVTKAMIEVLDRAGGNPGRSGHRLSVAAARAVYETRELVACLLGVSDPLRVIFTSNATHAINLALNGILRPGDSVVTTSMEHNAVMRPLRRLEKRGVRVKVASCKASGQLDPARVAALVDGTTRMLVMTHASNVAGTILPVAEIAAIAHRAGALLLVDAAQTAGALPINIEKTGIDLLAFTGHKELQGPTGIGGLVLGQRVDPGAIEPLMSGGTGSRSEFEEQPEDLPDKFEAGTANLVGIAGLGAGIRKVMETGIETIREHQKCLTRILVEDLSVIPKVKLYGTLEPDATVAIVSFSAAGQRVSEIGLRLDEEFGVLTRVGLHCAPAAHRTIGSFPEGTVRIAPGISTTVQEVKTAVQAVSKVLGS